VPVSWKIRGLRVSADPSADAGRHGHGDWMETDRCVWAGGDLLIPRAGEACGAGSLATACSYRKPYEDGASKLLGVWCDRSQYVGVPFDGEIHAPVVVDPSLPEAPAFLVRLRSQKRGGAGRGGDS
jgi:hypothetical protein